MEKESAIQIKEPSATTDGSSILKPIRGEGKYGWTAEKSIRSVQSRARKRARLLEEEEGGNFKGHPRQHHN